MQTKWTLYMHTNKINDKKYVGITSKAPEDRWVNGRGYDGQLFGNAIKKYGWDNFEHEVITTGDEETIKQLEMYYIRTYKTYNREFGYNVSMGGDGHKLTPSKLSEVRKEYGKTVYQYDINGEFVRQYDSIKSVKEYGYVRDNVKACLAGRNKSYKNYIWSNTPLTIEEVKEIANKAYLKKKIYQYDMDGKVVRSLDGCKDFTEYGFNFRCVSACCKKGVGHHNGYVFSNEELSEDEVKEVFKNSKVRRIIYQYDLEGNLLDARSTISSYAEKGFSPKSISDVINGKIKTHKGFKWSHLPPEEFVA